MNWLNKTVLVTGGAGSIGSEIVAKLLEQPVHSVRVFDNNEDGLFRLGRRFKAHPKIRCLLGDIRDRERVKMAMNGVDIVIHAAAVKNIEISEYNAGECCRVNVEGTVNLVECAMQEDVDRFLFISSDKAAEYSTLYGATKFIGERICIWASHISISTHFAALRFGNVIESRGNCFDVWRAEAAEGKPLSITHPDMKRYFWHIGEATDFVLRTALLMENGCTYVPKMKEYSVLDLAHEISSNIRIIGLRDGEKMSEILFMPHEKPLGWGNFWRIRN